MNLVQVRHAFGPIVVQHGSLGRQHRLPSTRMSPTAFSDETSSFPTQNPFRVNSAIMECHPTLVKPSNHQPAATH